MAKKPNSCGTRTLLCCQSINNTEGCDRLVMVPGELSSPRWRRIFSMTIGSSILAITFYAATFVALFYPKAAPSILNAHLSLCAEVMAMHGFACDRWCT